jgi:O-acetyl-ADP-ribose deacetylase (regulator of RNase III)
MAETRQKYPQGCATGEAVITGAGHLPARFVIHAVGPVWRGGEQGEEQQLSSAYQRSLQAAMQHNCQNVAFPSLSTGAYGYPVARAARTALQTVVAFLEAQRQPALVRFVLFDTDTYDSYAAALREVMAKG